MRNAAPILAAAIERRDLAGLAAYKHHRDLARHCIGLARAHREQALAWDRRGYSHCDARNHRQACKFYIGRAAHHRRNALNHLLVLD